MEDKKTKKEEVKLVDVRTAAKMLSISTDTLKRYERQGLIVSVRITPFARRRFHVADIERLAKRRK